MTREFFKAEITGAKEIDKALKAIGDKKLQQKILTAALRKSSNLLKKSAQEKAPRSGAPADPDEKGKNIEGWKEIKVRQERVQGFSVSMKIGPTKEAYYMMFQEFGTGARYHKSGKYVGSITPRPFLRPAFDENMVRMRDMLGDETFKQIEKTANKLNGRLRDSGLVKKKRR